MYVLLRVSNSRVLTTKPLRDVIEGHFIIKKRIKFISQANLVLHSLEIICIRVTHT